MERRNLRRNNKLRKDNVKYEDIEVITKNFGNNNFLEVVKRKAIVEKDGEVVENIFVQITRGFYSPEGEKRYKKGQRFSIPVDELENLISALNELNSLS